MTYADKLLADGETIVLRTRQHPLAFISDARNGLLLWVLAIVLVVGAGFFELGKRFPGVDQIIGLIALLLFFVGLLIVLWQYLLWWTEEYLVTSRRLMKVSGVVNKRSADSSLEKINDAILTQGFWGRVFNYGDLDILTAAESTVDSYRMLNGAPEFKKTMLNEKHALEMELSGARVVTAPLRADPPMVASPQMTSEPVSMSPSASTPSSPPSMDAGAGGPPPPPPAPADASLDVTQTLARLADLRDRGAISPDEYEAKKKELLGRL